MDKEKPTFYLKVSGSVLGGANEDHCCNGLRSPAGFAQRQHIGVLKLGKGCRSNLCTFVKHSKISAGLQINTGLQINAGLI